MPSFWIPVVASVLWSVGCLFAIRRILSSQVDRPLSHDRVFAVIGFLSLGLAPWISLVTYLADDGRSASGGIVNIVAATVLFLASIQARRRRLLPAEDAQSTMPFRQKSAALMALTLAVVYAVYFVASWLNPGLVVPLFLGSALLVVIVATAGHTILALFHAPVDDAEAPADERDREGQRYGIRSAYVVLALGIWIVPIVSILKWPFWGIANVAFAFAVLAEIVKHLSVVRYYRNGEP